MVTVVMVMFLMMIMIMMMMVMDDGRATFVGCFHSPPLCSWSSSSPHPYHHYYHFSLSLLPPIIRVHWQQS